MLRCPLESVAPDVTGVLVDSSEGVGYGHG